MTINSVGSATSLSALAPGSSTQRGTSPFEAVSDVLGMSADDIKSAVESGQSLMDLAEEQGVSEDDLLAALKENAPPELQGSDDLDEIVQQIANQTGSLGGPDGPPPGPPPAGEASGIVTGNLTDAQSTTLDVLSSLLDMDSDDLSSAIQDGSLSDLLQQAGVDTTDLANALETALAGSSSGFQVDVRL